MGLKHFLLTQRSCFHELKTGFKPEAWQLTAKSQLFEKRPTCACVVFGAVPVINVLLSDVKLGQSDGVHLHRISRLPHKLQVVRGVADWRRGGRRCTGVRNNLKRARCMSGISVYVRDSQRWHQQHRNVFQSTETSTEFIRPRLWARCRRETAKSYSNSFWCELLAQQMHWQHSDSISSKIWWFIPLARVFQTSKHKQRAQLSPTQASIKKIRLYCFFFNAVLIILQ